MPLVLSPLGNELWLWLHVSWQILQKKAQEEDVSDVCSVSTMAGPSPPPQLHTKGNASRVLCSKIEGPLNWSEDACIQQRNVGTVLLMKP